MVKKGTPRLRTRDVYKFIAQQSSLSVQQIQECFLAYYKIVMAAIYSDNRPEHFSIAFPHIGNIVFRRMKGKKKGDSYKVPNKNHKQDIIILEEDEPDYDKMAFELSRTMKKIVRERSLAKGRRQQSFNWDFLNKEDEENE